ncbi:MAG: hypothetical protein PHV39_08350 [Methanomicrobium sp.]|nr:hypothetical protein [Methanomicrobium sp.]
MVSDEETTTRSLQTQSSTENTDSDSLLYPDAYGRGDRVYFNDATTHQYLKGESGSTMSIYVENMKPSSGLYVKNLDTGDKSWIKPESGKEFDLISVTVSPTGAYSESYNSPFTWEFTLIDGSKTYSPKLNICPEMGVNIVHDLYHNNEWINEKFTFENFGEIYVSQNLHNFLNSKAGSDSISGWLLFEVPESFEITKDTYMKMNLGSNDIYWKFFDIMAAVTVSKNPTKGDIVVKFDGGPETQIIESINVKVILPDGTVNVASLTSDENQSQIPIGSEIIVSGSKPGEGEDHVIVYFTRMDGQKIVKYDGYLKASPRI